MAALEFAGSKSREVIDDDHSLTSMSSIDLHSRTMAAEYEALHLNSRQATPVNMVINKITGGSISRSDSIEWPDVSVRRNTPPGLGNVGTFSTLEICGKTPRVEPKVENVFEHRKGRPVESKRPLMQLLPDTVKLTNRAEEFVPDEELINVAKFTLTPKKTNLPAMIPATLRMVRFDESVRGVNDRMKMVTTPALGSCEPLGEARYVQRSKVLEIQRMRRYGAGVPPLKRISHLEEDLEKIIRRRKRGQRDPVKQEFLSPPRSRAETREGSPRHGQSWGIPEAPLLETGDLGDPADISASGMLDGNVIITSECSYPTLSTGQNLVPSDEEEEVDDDDDHCNAKFNQDLSIPTDLKVQRGQDPATSSVPKQGREEENTASDVACVRGSARAPIAENAIEQLYWLDDGDGGSGEPPFHHTREKLLSKKGKVYDCRLTCADADISTPPPGSSGASRVLSVFSGQDDLPEVSKMPSAEQGTQSFGDALLSASRPKSTDPRATLSSRYSDGKRKLAERTPTAALPGYIRKNIDAEMELKARVVCVTCTVEATMWCIQCERSYCPECWNKVSHHEFVDPDEVWINRRPAQPMLPCEHSEKGIQVHIDSRGKVSQGLPHKRYHRQGKRRMNRMSSFPAPNTIADKGFMYAQNWAALEDDGSVCSDSVKSNVSKSAGRLNVVDDEDMTNFGGEYLEALSQHDDIEDNLSDGEESSTAQTPPKKKLPYMRTTTIRRSPEKPSRVLSERAKSPATLMWQVATGQKSRSGGLVQVNKMQTPKNAKPMQGITAEYFPEAWKDTRVGISRTFEIHKGRSVATRKT